MALHDNISVSNTTSNGITDQSNRHDIDNIGVFKEYVLKLLSYNKSWFKNTFSLSSDRSDLENLENIEDCPVLHREYLQRHLQRINNNEKILKTVSNEIRTNDTALVNEHSFSEITLENRIGDSHLQKRHKFPFIFSNVDDIECPLEIAISETAGRYIKAKRYISAGEVLLVEPPIAIATRPKSAPNCLTCFKLTKTFNCPECGFFLCGPECITDDHKMECQFLKHLRVIESPEDRHTEDKLLSERLSQMPAEMRARALEMVEKAKEESKKQKHDEMMQQYVIMATLKTLFAVQKSDFNKTLILAMQANLDPESQRYKMNQKLIVDVIVNRLKASTDSDLLHKICSIWDTNAFQVVLPQNDRMQGLFPLAGLINHDCRPNAQQWFSNNGEIILRAMDSIPEGDSITISYTDPQWSTIARQNHLQKCKQFTCTCKRCLDPTELGTFLGSLVCNKCQSSMVSTDPLNTEAPWICNSRSCSHSIAAMKENDNTILSLGNNLGALTQKLNPRDVSAVMSLAKLLQGQVHPNHYTLMQMYMSVINALVDKDLAELDDAELGYLCDISARVSQVTKALQAPLARVNATTSREDLRLRLERIKREMTKTGNYDIRQKLMDMSSQLKECVRVLGWDSSMPSPLPLLQDYQALMEKL